jgi:hypothetical protein
VAELLAVLALDTRIWDNISMWSSRSGETRLTVARLGALAAGVTVVVAVAALDLGHVLRLVALLGHVTLLTTVATTTRAATTGRAILGEVSDW